MHVTLVDESIPFDGRTAAGRPLGGAEKAFAGLAAALAHRGHEVRAHTLTPIGQTIDGVRWEPLTTAPPRHTDLLVAFRKPTLLNFVRHAGRRALWITGPGRLLAAAPAQAALKSLAPLILLSAEAQAGGFDRQGLTAALMPPAVGALFLDERPASPVHPPVALVTSHPAHGLDSLISLWQTRIHPAVPEAELHLCSQILARAADGERIDPALRPLAERALAADAEGVRIIRPRPDAGMAEMYRAATLHLYPGHADDMGCFTLMESQACGCPAVVRPLGATGERIANGLSAYSAPDDDALVSLTVLLLTTPDVGAVMGREARGFYRGRDWDNAAMALEGWVS